MPYSARQTGWRSGHRSGVEVGAAIWAVVRPVRGGGGNGANVGRVEQADVSRLNRGSLAAVQCKATWAEVRLARSVLSSAAICAVVRPDLGGRRCHDLRGGQRGNLVGTQCVDCGGGRGRGPRRSTSRRCRWSRWLRPERCSTQPIERMSSQPGRCFRCDPGPWSGGLDLGGRQRPCAVVRAAIWLDPER